MKDAEALAPGPDDAERLEDAERPGDAERLEDAERPGDAERLEDAAHVLHGPRGDTARTEVAYAAYVTTIVVGLYGFPVLRALVVAADREGMADGLRSPWMLLVSAVVVMAVVLLAREAGRVRGPVVPPVPWVDLVVASSVDRWLALRPWFGYAVFAAVFAGGLSGLLVGASVVTAGVAEWWLVPVAVAAGVVIGLLGGWAWLLGQSRLSPPPPGGPERRPWLPMSHVRREVRRLGLPELRTQGARSTRLVGGVQTGDLRAVRLEAARPVTRARGVRLRHRGPVGTLVARDLVGLRRAPAGAAVGVVLSAAAGVMLGGVLGSPAIPPLVGFVAAMVSHLGFGAMSEGVRLEADTMGTPALLGTPPVRAAAAHLVVPGVLHLGATLAGAVGTAVALGTPVTTVLPWCVMATAIMAGARLLASYRGRPPTSPFSPAPNAQSVAIWYSMPLVLSTLLVGGMLWGAPRFASNGWFVITTWVVAVCVVYAGLSRVRSESLAHRDV